MSGLGDLYTKVKTFIERAVGDVETDAHDLTEAALPLFEHFEQQVAAIVKDGVAEVKVDAAALAESLRPVVRDEVSKLLVDLGIGRSDAPQGQSVGPVSGA